MKELITQAEFARRVGVSKVQVGTAIKTGRIKFARGTKKIDYEAALKLWQANRTDSLAGTGTANNTVRVPSIGKIQKVRDVKEVDSFSDEDDGEVVDESLTAQKIRKTKADAERVELKLAQEKGELIAKSDVLSVFFAFLVSLKNSIVATPERVVGDIQAAIEQYPDNPLMLKAKVYELLRTEHNRILEDIEDLIEKSTAEVQKIADKYR